MDFYRVKHNVYKIIYKLDKKMGVFNWILKECKKFEIKETLKHKFYKTKYNFYHLFSFTSTAKSYQYFMSRKTIKKYFYD